MEKTTMTRDEVIKALVEYQLDCIDDGCIAFETACANMIRYGRSGLEDLGNNELVNEYLDTFEPEFDIEIVEEKKGI